MFKKLYYLLAENEDQANYHEELEMLLKIFRQRHPTFKLNDAELTTLTKITWYLGALHTIGVQQHCLASEDKDAFDKLCDELETQAFYHMNESKCFDATLMPGDDRLN